MTTKEYMNRAYRADLIIESLLRQKEQLEDLATNITVSLSEKVQGGKRSGIAETVDKIIDLQNKINHEIVNLVDTKTEISSIISSVEDPDERHLLYLRYIEFKKWDEIAETMFRSSRHIFRLHKKALESASKSITCQ